MEVKFGVPNTELHLDGTRRPKGALNVCILAH
jgi:hypothetical protein